MQIETKEVLMDHLIENARRLSHPRFDEDLVTKRLKELPREDAAHDERHQDEVGAGRE
ncbi:hypothetical protein KW792_00805 [Candidatus Saccharibacteria bacterium]|nr:hypothetical protein [Candidatus Saccharibacteria bacterium]